MISLHDESISDIVRKAMPSQCYIATFSDNIYYTYNDTSTVKCNNLQGEIKWTFQNESVLTAPRFIDVDGDGNVYVAGLPSNNVVVMSPDGQQHREMLTESEDINLPIPLHYSGQKNQLLIANIRNTAHLFNVI